MFVLIFFIAPENFKISRQTILGFLEHITTYHEIDLFFTFECSRASLQPPFVSVGLSMPRLCAAQHACHEVILLSSDNLLVFFATVDEYLALFDLYYRSVPC